MQLFLKKRAPDQIEFGIIYGGIALAILGAGWSQSILSFAPDCVFKGLTGIPFLPQPERLARTVRPADISPIHFEGRGEAGIQSRAGVATRQTS